jgi:hypothetical protein
MNALSDLIAWRLGSIKFGLPTIAVLIAVLLVIVCVTYFVVRSRRGFVK